MPSHEMTPRRCYLILFNVCIATFMSTLDGSIVNISLPTISNYFSVSIDTVQWTVTAYLLVTTSLLLVFGRISDLYSRRILFAVGLGVFTLGSLLCGMSASFPMLVASRILQAVGAAVTMALVQGIVTSIFPPTERGKALGIVGTVVAVGSLLGPSLGGILVHVATWRAIFYVNLPFGVAGVVLTFLLMPESVRRADAGAFDWKGSLLFVASIALLFLGLLTLQDGLLPTGWELGMLALAAALFSGFLRFEKRQTSPLLDVAMFRNRTFALGLATAYLSFLAMFSYLFFMPFYLQDVLKLDVLTAGLLMSVYPLTTGILAPISGWLSDRRKNLPLPVMGLALTTCALTALSFLNTSSPTVAVVLPVFVMGVGGALFNSPNTSQIMGSVSRDKLGVAGSIAAFFRNFGMVSGTALSVLLFMSVTRMRIDQFVGETFNVLLFLRGFRVVLVCAAALALLGVLLSLIKHARREKVLAGDET